MTVGDFDLYYGDNPWQVIDKNQRTWYDPELTSLYRQRAIFTPTIQFVKNLGSVSATKMVLNQMLDPHPDISALNVRQIWMPASHIDSRQLEIEFSRYGGKVAYTTYDEIVNYWKQNNQAGIQRIMRGALGQHMVDVLDLLARNAYISGSLNGGFNRFVAGSNFSGIGTGDLFSLDLALDVFLGMATKGVNVALGPSGAAGSILCYTSPSVIYDIQKGAKSDEWINATQYDSLRYEVGSYKSVRFIQSPKLILWNAGTLIAQGNVTAAINAGDGAPNPATTKVDGTYMVGQSSAGVANSITIGSWGTGAIGNIAVDDMVTIHVSRSAAYGVSNGLNIMDGKAQTRRVVAKSTTPDTLTFDQPIMVDMNTDLGGGVYAYVTKARNIHASIFIGAPNSIVSGVAVAPRIHAPGPVDDFEMVQRFSWDAYIGHQMYDPQSFEVVFSAGTTRIIGAPVVQ